MQGVECMTGLTSYYKDRDKAFTAGIATQLARIYSQMGQYEQSEKCLTHVLRHASFCSQRRIRAVAYYLTRLAQALRRR